MNDKKKSVFWRILTNPILIMTVLFAVWIVFFDSNGYFSEKRQKRKAEALKEQAEFYEDGVEKMKSNIKSIEEDPEELEKFARENYMYKKKGEVIYLVEEKEKK